MAREDLEVRTLASDDGDLGIPTTHVAHAVLHRDDTGLSGDVEHRLQAVRRLGVVRVLEEDEGKTRLLVDLLVAVLRRTRLVAESKPSVRRVEETALAPAATAR